MRILASVTIVAVFTFFTLKTINIIRFWHKNYTNKKNKYYINHHLASVDGSIMVFLTGSLNFYYKYLSTYLLYSYSDSCLLLNINYPNVTPLHKQQSTHYEHFVQSMQL